MTGATAAAQPAGDNAAAAVDGDASTRWSSGQAQEQGQYLRITSTGAADNWWSIADVRVYN